MKDLKQFNIPFIGLKEGSHLFTYQIDKTFFELFQFDDYFDANIKALLTIVKKSTFLELSFSAIGTVNIPCDTTNEPFDQEINTSLPLIVRFGSVFNNESDEILILPHGSFELNVAQYIYEMIILSVPAKRTHPNLLNGTMESETLKKLKELEITKVQTAKEADPRWDKLKDLLTEKKT